MPDNETSEPAQTIAYDPVCGWIKLWNRRGVQVTFPLRGGIDTFAAQVDSLFDAGWLAEAPWLEEGEEIETVGYICHGQGEGNRGTYDFVLLYTDNDAMHYSFLKVYLDNAEDVRAFEFAAKQTLESLPVYVGDNKPERGKSKQVDRFIVPVKAPFKVVLKKNPKYDPAETDIKKKKPARLFVRWADAKPVNEAAPKSDGKPDLTVIDEWNRWLDGEPPIDVINDRLEKLFALDKATKEPIANRIKATLEKSGYQFDKNRRAFVFVQKSNNQEFAEAGF